MQSLEPGGLDQSSVVRHLKARIRELERWNAELEARHERASRYWQQLESVIDTAPLTIYLKDARFKYVFVNREYERLGGHPRQDVIGRDDFELFPEPVARIFREQDEQVLARGAPMEFRETIPLPDGIHSFITGKFPLMAGTTVGGVGGVCTEVTALEEAKRRLEETQGELVKRERLATLGELSAVIAHEVRNPLGVVFNALAALRHQTPAQSPGHALLGVIAEEADRLNRLVTALLDLARPVTPELEACPIEPLVRGAIDTARALADPSAEVVLELDGPADALLADGQMLRQALVNLVANAIQAAGRRSPVRVRITEEALLGVVRFAVIDDGAGVPPKLVERVFTPFYTTRAKGTGLGLAIVRRVAEAHQGTATVEPTPGGGATFVLRVPRAPPAHR